MKRIIVGVCAVAILSGLLAASASAAIKHFAGSVNGGGRVAFDVQFINGKPRAAGNFELRRVPMTCDDGDHLIRWGTDNGVNVTNQRRFTYRFDFGELGTAQISGRISKNGTRASGATSFASDVPPNLTNCTTGGARRWNAAD
jgi:hypothetical protein